MEIAEENGTRREGDFMWYMIQTQEGREQELVDAIRGSAGDEFGKHLGDRCFFLQREAVWRRDGRCIKHLDVLFPGCVFVESDGEAGFSQRLEEFLCRLESVQPGFLRTGEALGEKSGVTGTANSKKVNGDSAPVTVDAKADRGTVVPGVKDIGMMSGSASTGTKDAKMENRSNVTGMEFAFGSEAGGGFSKSGTAVTGAGGISGSETGGRPESPENGGYETLEAAGERPEKGRTESSVADARLRGEVFVAPERLSDESGLSDAEGFVYSERSVSQKENGKTNGKMNAQIPVYPIREEDRRILESLLDGDREHIVRLSPVEVDENKEIVGCGGALRHYREEIVRKRIRLRYVIVRIPFFSGLRDVLLGIRLEGDDEGSAVGLA